MTVSTAKIHLAAGVGACFCALLLASCASVPPPTAELSAAQSAVSAASEADAEQYAGAELAEAQQRLSAAQRASGERDYDEALKLALQAQAAADLAAARSRAATARAEVQDRTRENARLRKELTEAEDRP